MWRWYRGEKMQRMSCWRSKWSKWMCWMCSWFPSWCTDKIMCKLWETEQYSRLQVMPEKWMLGVWRWIFYERIRGQESLRKMQCSIWKLWQMYLGKMHVLSGEHSNFWRESIVPKVHVTLAPFIKRLASLLLSFHPWHQQWIWLQRMLPTDTRLLKMWVYIDKKDVRSRRQSGLGSSDVSSGSKLFVRQSGFGTRMGGVSIGE